MSKNFRTCALDQPFLMPPSLQDWLPESHLARFAAELTDGLDLSDIYDFYGRRDGRGRAAYHPVMMVRLLLYGYSVGVMSSRRMERASYDDVAFRYLCADQHPDHDTIAAFRQQHLPVLAQLFTQVLQLCNKAGLVKLGHVAIDGTKLQANASKHKAMSYDRMEEKEKQLKAEVEKLLARAAETDAAEEAQYGKGKRGDELTGELARRESRLKKIAEAKAALEQEARERAEAAKKAAEEKIEERRKKEQERGKKLGGYPPQVPDPEQARPDPKAQRNFTDPESRIMPDGGRKGSFVQAYNAQIAVDGAKQIIVAAAITQESNDKQQLAPMLERVEQNLGAKPVAASADAGYFSQDQISDERVKGIELYVATGKHKHGQPEPAEAIQPDRLPAKSDSAMEKMKQKLKTETGQALYKMRKAIVEPVFGQIKAARGIRAFLLRGIGKAGAEWKLICATHNLLKLFRSGHQPQPA
ncbi:MAG TPA: IS1182 family transposase [Bryobacteraceae bacterium]|nr:IS1182 family transposase [Bryobacteraceae bacterium]